jgi:hypothetical protein
LLLKIIGMDVQLMHAYASSLCTYPAYAAYVFQVMVLAAALVTKPHACALMSNHYYVALRVRIDLA